MKGFCQGVKGTTFKDFFLKFDKKFIEQEKSKYCNGTEFVSTNDVLTSWFGNLIQKRSAAKFDNLMVAFDCRSRVPGVEQNMAGNYMTTPIMRKSDLETPKTVRNWINFVTEKGNSWSFPSYSEFRRFIGGINTSWVKFYHHVEPEGLEQVLHSGEKRREAGKNSKNNFLGFFRLKTLKNVISHFEEFDLKNPKKKI